MTSERSKWGVFFYYIVALISWISYNKGKEVITVTRKKDRFIVDLEPELKEWLEKTVLKLSYERGIKLSRNQVIAEALTLFKEHLEKEDKQK